MNAVALTVPRSDEPEPEPRPRGRRWFALRALVMAVVLGVLLPPAHAWAAPPTKLPESVTAPDDKWQPALDYDTDGCYSTPAIGPDGTLNAGLNPTGALNGSCRDASDLVNTNAYSRSACDPNGWCAYMYGLYFEKDQALSGVSLGGHRHDWEHIVVWVYQDQARYVSASEHGRYVTRAASEIPFDGTHAKIVYHKDGASTHAFRFAGFGEAPENHFGVWQYPDLVSWNNYPAGIRDILTGANFGSATFALKDANIRADLAKAKPGAISFTPQL